MKLYYTPIISRVTEYSQEFLDFLKETLIHYFEEEEYKELVNINKELVLTKEHMFFEQNGAIYFYSGFLKKIIYNYPGFNITSKVKKYKCSDKKVSDVLYKHQNKIVQAALKHNRGIIKSPTSSGKSFTIGDLIRRYVKDNLNVLITVPTIDLLHQLTKDIQKVFELHGETLDEVGQVGDGKFNFKQVTVGIPQSLSKIDKTAEYLNTVNALISDECQTVANGTYSKIIHQMSSMQVALAFSATPWVNGAGHTLLNAFFGELIIEVEEAEMINNNIILEPEFVYYPAPKVYIPPHLSKPASSISTLSNAYRYKVLNEVYESVICNNKGRNDLIATIGEQRIKENVGPIVVLVSKIRGDFCHGKILQNMFSSKGIDLPIIGGHISKKRRASIIEDLKNNKLKGVIAGPKVLSAGISIPSLSTIILANAGKSDSEFIQRVGRLLRKKEGKQRPQVIDFIDSQYWFANQSRSRIEVAENVYGKDNIRYV